jgi:HAE1 family hydrophobic/amphiphilic exporter-1
MTSTAIIAGALPTALGLHLFSGSEGSEFRQGLADVLIGGLLTSTLLTLLVVPTAYSLLDSLTVRLGRLFQRRQSPQAQPALALAGAGPTAKDSPANGVYSEDKAARLACTGARLIDAVNECEPARIYRQVVPARAR